MAVSYVSVLSALANALSFVNSVKTVNSVKVLNSVKIAKSMKNIICNDFLSVN